MAKPGGFDPRWAPLAAPGAERFEHILHGLFEGLCRCGLAFDGDTILGVATSAPPAWSRGHRAGWRAPLSALASTGAADVTARSSGNASTGASRCASPLWARTQVQLRSKLGRGNRLRHGHGCLSQRAAGRYVRCATSCRGFCASVAARERFGSTAGGPARATCGGCAAAGARFACSAGLPRAFDEFLNFVVGDDESAFVLAAGAPATAGDPPDAASEAGGAGVSDSAAPGAAGAPTSLARASSASNLRPRTEAPEFRLRLQASWAPQARGQPSVIPRSPSARPPVWVPR